MSMGRRGFLSFLRAAPIVGAATLGSVLTTPTRAEDIEGLTVTNGGSLVITNCIFNLGESTGPAISQVTA